MKDELPRTEIGGFQMMARGGLQSMKEPELLKLYAELMGELRRREIIRTSNNPVADYAERIVVDRLKLDRASKEAKGYDATDQEGKKYQIKGRRFTSYNNSRQLSVIRNLKDNLFDYLIAVIFDETFNVLEMWKIPHSAVERHSLWSGHTKGHILRLGEGGVLADESVERIG